MKPITQEWVRKAEADFVTAERELAATTNQKLRRSLFSLAAVCREIPEGQAS